MSTRPEVEAKPAEFRPIHTKPLFDKRWLIAGVIFFGVTGIGGCWAAWWYGTLLAAFIPVPSLVMLGVSLAGLFPRYFFNN